MQFVHSIEQYHYYRDVKTGARIGFSSKYKNLGVHTQQAKAKYLKRMSRELGKILVTGCDLCSRSFSSNNSDDLLFFSGTSNTSNYDRERMD
uniref:Uncharacterized protein n=1 Tax=Oryza punctata TaxID=4537 RepID=A0A0E0K9Q2_ORYPU